MWQILVFEPLFWQSEALLEIPWEPKASPSSSAAIADRLAGGPAEKVDILNWRCWSVQLCKRLTSAGPALRQRRIRTNVATLVQIERELFEVRSNLSGAAWASAPFGSSAC